MNPAGFAANVVTRATCDLQGYAPLAFPCSSPAASPLLAYPQAAPGRQSLNANVGENIKKCMRAAEIKCGACANLSVHTSTVSTRKVWATLPDITTQTSGRVAQIYLLVIVEL